MTPEEKQAASNIVALSDEPWGVECTKIIHDTCKVALSILPQLQTCIILSKENPLQTTRGLPQDESYPVKRVTEEEKSKAKNQCKKANYELNILQLKI